ncbi:hypothetical protein LJR231_005658 [Phyllobacterium sp. LjRoot231]|uniref:DUF6904 family protein n=1 Tax=Phyllobacterium sp. LjRoot231 TaxID=3342289 RepID=UPI003ECD2759
MLQYSLSKECAGLTLWGDEASLRNLRSVIIDINDHSPAIENKDSLVVALAYDLRKAFEVGRRVNKVTDRRA